MPHFRKLHRSRVKLECRKVNRTAGINRFGVNEQFKRDEPSLVNAGDLVIGIDIGRVTSETNSS